MSTYHLACENREFSWVKWLIKLSTYSYHVLPLKNIFFINLPSFVLIISSISLIFSLVWSISIVFFPIFSILVFSFSYIVFIISLARATSSGFEEVINLWRRASSASSFINEQRSLKMNIGTILIKSLRKFPQKSSSSTHSMTKDSKEAF